MKAGHLHVCLFQPEIPQNAGNIGRLVAATQCRLHLIKPFGFDTNDKNLRRAGLDYWPFLDLEIHDSLDPLIKMFHPRMAFFSKKATRSLRDLPAETDLLIFGQETSGLPDDLWQRFPELFYSVPMFHPGVRSLNLANTVSLVVYRQLEQRRLF